MLRVLFLILVLASSSVLAQTEEKPKAYLFDEFKGVSLKEIKTRTEKLKKKLKENAWSKNFVDAYLIFYYDKKQKSSDKQEKLVRFELSHKCYDCMGWNSRIVFISGGEAESRKIQFWIVPQGAEPPKP